MDIYQQRYLKHQQDKKNTIATEEKPKYTDAEIMTVFTIMNERRSQRVFNGEVIEEDKIKGILRAAELAPSSCNRKAVSIKMVRSEKDKSLLAEFLVGGAGWIDKADTILLLLANMAAYKSPAEVDFMPYLDSGVIAENIYLISEALCVGACFVNPNVRASNQDEFNSLFIPYEHKFCGAIALGEYDKREAKKQHLIAQPLTLSKKLGIISI